MTSMIRIDPYLGSPLHRWVMGIVIAVHRTISHDPFTPIDTGLRRRLLHGTIFYACLIPWRHRNAISLVSSSNSEAFAAINVVMLEISRSTTTSIVYPMTSKCIRTVAQLSPAAVSCILLCLATLAPLTPPSVYERIYELADSEF
jgi:hypothetical protein